VYTRVGYRDIYIRRSTTSAPHGEERGAACEIKTVTANLLGSTHGESAPHGWRESKRRETKVRMVWGSVLIAAAARSKQFKTPTRAMVTTPKVSTLK